MAGAALGPATLPTTAAQTAHPVVGIGTDVQMGGGDRCEPGEAQCRQRADDALSHPVHRLEGLSHSNTTMLEIVAGSSPAATL